MADSNNKELTEKYFRVNVLQGKIPAAGRPA